MTTKRQPPSDSNTTTEPAAASAESELPHNVPAEQTLLGSLLINNKLLDRIPERLAAEHFYSALHGRIFDVIHKRVKGGAAASPTLLLPYFRSDDAIQDVGGPGYLAKLTESAVSTTHVSDYANTILMTSLQRGLMEFGSSIEHRARSCEDPDELIREGEQTLYHLSEHNLAHTGFKPFSVLLTEAVEQAEKTMNWRGETVGKPTGLTDLDKITGGLRESDLIIIAGRTSMGKSALAVNIAHHVAECALRAQDLIDDEERKIHPHHGVAYFSLEMSATQLATRILSSRARIPAWKLGKGQVSQDDFQTFTEAAGFLQDLPLFIDDTAALSIENLCARARRLKRDKGGLDLIVVDYLQLVESSHRRANRVEQVAEVSRGLKGLAKELAVPVIALAQLSRQVEGRDNKKPQLSDLRESGSIEQDADIVAFIHREAYYLEREKPREDEQAKFLEWQAKMNEIHNLAELYVGKHRNGPTGNIALYFDPHHMQFGDLDQHAVPQQWAAPEGPIPPAPDDTDYDPDDE